MAQSWPWGSQIAVKKMIRGPKIVGKLFTLVAIKMYPKFKGITPDIICISVYLIYTYMEPS